MPRPPRLKERGIHEHITYAERELIALKWTRGFNFNDLAQEYGLRPETVRDLLRRHMSAIMEVNDRLEKNNAWLWEERLTLPKERKAL